ncbi:hypothetical protein EYC84_000616 [Monilinia fructicola]|uniref:Uncharacterized protein n=1 Tax=Monilinia fructicola TaxID=38448 RepID=A0A5M9JSB1_MONFR|nr:hypothetical protein EYC84_000616 [Monilinia fructicola]
MSRPQRPGLLRNNFSAHNAADLKRSPHERATPFGFQLVSSNTASAPNGAAATVQQNQRWLPFSAVAPLNGVVSDDASGADVIAAPALKSHAAKDYNFIGKTRSSASNGSFTTKATIANSATSGAFSREASSIGSGPETTFAEYMRRVKGKGRAIDSSAWPMEMGDSYGNEVNEAFNALEAARALIAQSGYTSSWYRATGTGVSQNTCTTTIAGPSGRNGRKWDDEDHENNEHND